MNSDTKIDKAVEALQAVEPTVGAADRLKARLRQEPKPARRPVRLGFAAVAAAGLAVAFVAWPRPSFADELKAIFQSQALIGNRHEVQLSRDPATGEMRVTRELWARGQQVKEQFEDAATLYVDGDRVLNDFVKEGYAAVSTEGPRSGLSLVTLDYVLTEKHTNSWTKTSAVRVGGQTMDKYTVRFSNGGPELVANYFVNPVDKRFGRIELVAGGRLESVVEISYGGVTAGDVAFQPRRGETVYDYDKQRQEVLAAVRQPQWSATVAGQTVGLCGVYVDESGNLQVLTRGVPAQLISRERPMRIDGQEVRLSAVLFDVQSATLPGARAEQSVPLAGFATMADWLRPGVHDVELPVHIGGKQATVTFKGVDVRKTGSLPYMLSPMNVPFWIQSRPGGSAAKAVAAG